jgi:hypothetical protein
MSNQTNHLHIKAPGKNSLMKRNYTMVDIITKHTWSWSATLAMSNTCSEKSTWACRKQEAELASIMATKPTHTYRNKERPNYIYKPEQQGSAAELRLRSTSSTN